MRLARRVKALEGAAGDGCRCASTEVFFLRDEDDDDPDNYCAGFPLARDLPPHGMCPVCGRKKLRVLVSYVKKPLPP